MSYSEASQNFYGSWLNPDHFEKNIQVFNTPMAFLKNGIKLPADRLLTGKSLERYTLIKSFSNETENFVIKYDPFFGHTILDTLPWIFFMAANRPKAKFILLVKDYLDRQSMDNSKRLNKNLLDLKKRSEQNVFDFTVSALDRLKIDYQTISLGDNEMMVLSNAFVVIKNPTEFGRHSAIACMLDFIKKEIIRQDTLNDRKVYISRRKVSTDDFVDENDTSNNQHRIINEEKFELFLSSLGFEIVYPEDFKTFDEQINFFASVKVLAGCTTSGLNNQLWMRDGGTVIEFATPIYLLNHFEIHTHYQAVASFKAHNIIRIPVVDNNAESIIKNIKSNKHLLSALENS